MEAFYKFKMYRKLGKLLSDSIKNYCDKYNLTFEIKIKKRFLLKSKITLKIIGDELKIYDFEKQLSYLLKFVI